MSSNTVVKDCPMCGPHRLFGYNYCSDCGVKLR